MKKPIKFYKRTFNKYKRPSNPAKKNLTEEYKRKLHPTWQTKYGYKRATQKDLKLKVTLPQTFYKREDLTVYFVNEKQYNKFKTFMNKHFNKHYNPYIIDLHTL